MRLIDADAVTTDSVSFGRIGDFENSSAPRPRQGTCGQWTIYVGDQHRSLLMRPAKPAAARVKKLLLRKVRFWRKADTWLVSCFSMFQRISASPPQIRSGELDDLVGTSIENGLQHVKREALRHLRG